MKKEMMDKINEVLKAKGKRELSLDEMDKVSGGNMWTEMGYGEFTDFWLDMARNFGYDVTIEMFKEATGYVTYSSGIGTSPGGDSDEDKMGVVLRNFWGCIEADNGHH